MKYYFSILQILLSVYLLCFFVSCQKSIRQVNDTDRSNDSAGNNKPNIIFIVGDDVGYEIPTCNGGQSYSTPNIDKLAANGMRFTQCRSTPLCSPSRFMLLTGKYNFRNYTVWGVMDKSQRTIGNMLRDAGYVTCYAGKWQLDGGDASIRTFGFDSYRIWLPFKNCPEQSEGSRYKSAKIYQDGGYLPADLTNNKYSEDEFTDYVLNFLDDNKSQPFFIYYSMILCHQAFSPTPDDPGYAAWNPDPAVSDPKYFPSMVHYMDKKIGQVLGKLQSLGLENNTAVFFIGDNGTKNDIKSVFNNKIVQGAKGRTVDLGIHVPLICRWPGKVAAGTVNGDLIDLTDILPTLANVTNIPKPANYGPLDGESFYSQLRGQAGTPGNWVFCHFAPNQCQSVDSLKRYVQDSVYKLYENGKFYKFTTDKNEKQPLPTSSLSHRQKKIRQNFQNVLDKMPR